MHPGIAKQIVDLCRRRISQGDCPVEEPASTERLEELVVQLFDGKLLDSISIDNIIRAAADKLMGWKLPEDFYPDCGISFKKLSDYDHPEFGRTKYEPTGTNLFNVTQARAMFEYCLISAITQELTNSGEISALTYQTRVKQWLDSCFSQEVISDKAERNRRFIEEAIELVQACEMPKEAIHAMVEHIYSRPVGEKAQEVGGVEVSLSALCTAHGIDTDHARETELTRCFANIPEIRAKQLLKPKF
jgi:hypothetical protein